uniref:Fibronectin type-III domain-containing protein n=1 Tax=Panagrellus redivivus TaxID=6233 RepID=A0A7E4W2E1_PANRE
MCCRLQALYFEERVVRFVRIQCTDLFLKIDANIEALYSTDPFEIDPETTLVVPNQNIVPTEMSYEWDTVTGGGYIDGYIVDGYVQHEIDSTSMIIFQFLQPYFIGSIKLLLDYTSSFVVAISSNGNGDSNHG